MVKNLFIAGKPASGKTTLIREICLPYMDRIGGFYTEEIIEGGERKGFLLKAFDGRQGVLAKKGLKAPLKLNKYGVDINVIDNIGVDALNKALDLKDLIVIDEIGSIEILSNLFRQVLLNCLNSDKKVLATIRYNAQPFTDEIKKMANTSIIYLSRDNFLETKKSVKEWLKTFLET